MKYNLGPGNGWKKEGWKTIDCYVAADINVDFRKMEKFPIESNSCDVFFASHVLEHMSDEAGIFTLKECYRCLKASGTLRISVPDYDKAYLAMKLNYDYFFDRGGVWCSGNSIEEKFVNYLASYRQGSYSGGPKLDNPKIVRDNLDNMTKDEFIKWCASLIPEEAEYKAHVNGYYYEKMNNFLKLAGFNAIAGSSYQQSFCKELQSLEFDNRPLCSLYFEAVK